MSLHDNTSIEVELETYERIAVMAATFGKSPEAMLDMIVKDELDRAADRARAAELRRGLTAIDVSDEIYDRLDAAALIRGTTQDALLDMIVVKGLDRAHALAEQLERAREARTTITCSCCGGRCKEPLRWRGTLRCGCPNASRDAHLHLSRGL